jgi:2-oxoglutarate dehydrogenase E1 component
VLRHTACLSKFEDIGPGSSFQPMLKYANCDRISECSTVFLVSGKYVYDVQQLIQKKGATKTCLLAIEELYPFPEELLQESLKGLSPSAKIFWIQEENFNGGPYQFVENRMNRVLGNLGVSSELRFVGRRAIACTAIGSVELHKQ